MTNSDRRKVFYRVTGGILVFVFMVAIIRVKSPHEENPSVLSVDVVDTPAQDITVAPSDTLLDVPDYPDNSLLAKNWSIVGVEKTQNGLLVHSIKRELMEQDGRFAELNPPINLSGVHVDYMQGDFTVLTRIDLQNAKMASLQLYGRVPIIADEFKVERESVRLEMDSKGIKVSLWNGYKQTPVTQSFILDLVSPFDLSISRKGTQLVFSVNRNEIGRMDEAGVFASNQIWFGLDGQGGDWLLSNLEVNTSESESLSVVDSIKDVTKHDERGLQNLISKKRRGFLIGASAALGPAATDLEYANLLFDNSSFGTVTFENAMKMINLQPQRGVFTFEEADALLNLAKKNGLSVHGHTLVFGEANPSWFSSMPVSTPDQKKDIEQIMLNHISTVVKHFGSNVSSWDVINEPLDEDAESGNVFRKHKWYQVMGQDFMIKALIAAHQENPDAMLFVNEWGLEEDSERWDVFVAMMQRLKVQLIANNIPTEKVGVGFQAHVYERGDRINPATLRKHIKQLESMGFVAQISEMDVYSDDGAEVQAKQYADVLKVCVEEKNCIRWNAWILSDKYNYWKDDDGSIQKGVDGLYDSNLEPRPAVSKMKEMLRGLP